MLRVGDAELRIEPKVPAAHILHLLARGRQWGRWFEQDVHLDSIADLQRAIAHAFSMWCERVLRRGALRGYLGVRASEPTIRGRWLLEEQVRHRAGIALPAELDYDDFTDDIPENRLVRAAVRRLLAAPLPPPVRARLRVADRVLGGVVPLARGRAAPPITIDRRSEHYRPLLALARLIHDGDSLEHRSGDVLASGYLLDLARIFEDYLAAAIADEVRPYGGEIRSQETRAFDRDGRAEIRPDLLWMRGGRPFAVFDAKYKAEKPSGHPNADLYQALAYALRLRLRDAHLVYAAGSAVPARYEVEHAGITVVAHALDLSLPPAAIDHQVALIVGDALNPTGSQVHAPDR